MSQMASYGVPGSSGRENNKDSYKKALAERADRRTGRPVHQEVIQARYQPISSPNDYSHACMKAEEAVILQQAFPYCRLRKIVPSSTLRSQFTTAGQALQAPAATNDQLLHHPKPTRKSRNARSFLDHYDSCENTVVNDDEDEDKWEFDGLSSPSSRSTAVEAEVAEPSPKNALIRTDSVLSLRVIKHTITGIAHPRKPANDKATVSPHFFIGHEKFYAKQKEAERLKNLPKPEPDWLAAVDSAFDWDDDEDEDRWERMVSQKVRQHVRRLSQSSRRLSDTGRRMSGGAVSRSRRLSDAAKKAAGMAVAALTK